MRRSRLTRDTRTHKSYSRGRVFHVVRSSKLWLSILHIELQLRRKYTVCTLACMDKLQSRIITRSYVRDRAFWTVFLKIQCYKASKHRYWQYNAAINIKIPAENTNANYLRFIKCNLQNFIKAGRYFDNDFYKKLFFQINSLGKIDLSMELM